MSIFIEAALQGDVFTWNGAISNSTTSSALLDYFGKCGTYVKRSQADVDASMASIFAEDPAAALRLIFGMRLISRKPKKFGKAEVLPLAGIEETQTGFGRRDEFYKAVKWLYKSRPDVLINNLHMIPICGSWKDFIEIACQNPEAKELRIAIVRLMYNHLDDGLLLKFLPTIRSKSNLKNRSEYYKEKRTFALLFCYLNNMTARQYAKLKSTGPGHVWQRQMSGRQWDAINFNGIPGKAMFKHLNMSGKDNKNVFERHGQLERLKTWVLEQPVIKFTGYPYELLKAAKESKNYIQKLVIDRQFAQVLAGMESHQLGNVLCALDTSGSMSVDIVPGVSAMYICMSMGICFSSMNTGHFKDEVAMFDSTSRMLKLKGSFCEKVDQIPANAMGSTNFQSVIDLIVKIRIKNPDISISEFPETLLVLSDMQFNPVDGNTETNYKAAMSKLQDVGLGEMRIIWWCLNGESKDFPSKMNDKGVYIIGGFDPVNLKALMGKKKEVIAENQISDHQASVKVEKSESPLDGLNNWLSQPIFDLLVQR